ncbi:hypothetical protein LEN26_014420 [Aphanomyces euteiches]|nr:hypothetical protein LEN26_014420 [Aphanomyces euteiches]KAH9117344.1 hypothetical protein AeMF1_008882 [Aphanomyces euteiches]
MLTCLSLLWKPKSQATDSNKKTWVRFQYRVPVVGDVCRIAYVSESHVVLTMDFSQNLTLPNAASTPSQWYFLSLVSISVFGIFDVGLNVQSNIVYSERVGGKGSNEVISMLDRDLKQNSALGQNKTLALYADNCGGQNKNNFVIKYLLMATYTGRLAQVDYNFFVKGHTKNACIRMTEASAIQGRSFSRPTAGRLNTSLM